MKKRTIWAVWCPRYNDYIPIHGNRKPPRLFNTRKEAQKVTEASIRGFFKIVKVKLSKA